MVKQGCRLEWDSSVMAICWSIWSERNNRIFHQKARLSSILYENIYSFITFWLVNLPKKQGKTFVRGRTKGTTGKQAFKSEVTSPVGDGCYFWTH